MLRKFYLNNYIRNVYLFMHFVKFFFRANYLQLARFFARLLFKDKFLPLKVINLNQLMFNVKKHSELIGLSFLHQEMNFISDEFLTPILNLNKIQNQSQELYFIKSVRNLKNLKVVPNNNQSSWVYDNKFLVESSTNFHYRNKYFIISFNKLRNYILNAPIGFPENEINLNKAFVIKSSGVSNFSHLFKDLSFLYFLNYYYPECKDVIFDVNVETKYYEEVLKPFRRYFNFWLMNNDSFYSVDNAIIVDPFNGDDFTISKMRLRYFASAFKSDLSMDFNWENIYISRKNDKSRRVINELELVNILIKHNFKVLHLEDYTLEQQVRIFSNAKNVIGPSGTGLSKIIFCKPNLNLYIFTTKRWLVDIWFDNLSNELEFNPFKYIDYKKRSYDDIFVDIREFKETLGRMLGLSLMEIER